MSRPFSASPWRRLRRRSAAALLLTLLIAAAGPVSGGEPRDAQRLRAWGSGQRLELLPLQQSSFEVLARSQVTLLIRPHDLSSPTPELWITPPPTLDGRSLARKLRLCRSAVPIASRFIPCLKELPLRLEARSDRLRLLPQRPLQPEEAYALQLLLRNPLQQGFHPLRLAGLSPEHPEPLYLGTWLLQTDAQTD